MTHFNQVSGGGEPRRPRAYHCHSITCHLCNLRLLHLALGQLPVGYVALQAADSYRGPLLAQGADLFALCLLGADPAADAGQAVFTL